MTPSKAITLKEGDKLRIIGEPGHGYYGHEQHGRVITFVKLMSSGILYCSGFSGEHGSEFGGIDQMFVELAARAEPPTFDAKNIKKGMWIETGNGDKVMALGPRTLSEDGQRFGPDLINLKFNSKKVVGRTVLRVWAAPTLMESLGDFAKRGKLIWESPLIVSAREERQQKQAVLQKQIDALVLELKNLNSDPF